MQQRQRQPLRRRGAASCSLTPSLHLSANPPRLLRLTFLCARRTRPNMGDVTAPPARNGSPPKGLDPFTNQGTRQSPQSLATMHVNGSHGRSHQYPHIASLRLYRGALCVQSPAWATPSRTRARQPDRPPSALVASINAMLSTLPLVCSSQGKSRSYRDTREDRLRPCSRRAHARLPPIPPSRS